MRSSPVRPGDRHRPQIIIIFFSIPLPISRISRTPDGRSETFQGPGPASRRNFRWYFATAVTTTCGIRPRGFIDSARRVNTRRTRVRTTYTSEFVPHTHNAPLPPPIPPSSPATRRRTLLSPLYYDVFIFFFIPLDAQDERIPERAFSSLLAPLPLLPPRNRRCAHPDVPSDSRTRGRQFQRGCRGQYIFFVFRREMSKYFKTNRLLTTSKKKNKCFFHTTAQFTKQ